MAGIAVHRVTNANAYLNGKSLLGQVLEANLPQLKTLDSEHNALGLFGKMKFATGLDVMEAKLKFTSFYQDAIMATADPYAVHEIQLRFSADQYGAQGRTGQLPGVCFLRGQFKNPMLGNFKQHDNVEVEADLTVWAVRFELGGKVLLNIDVMANIYEVNGVDILQAYRQNIGG